MANTKIMPNTEKENAYLATSSQEEIIFTINCGTEGRDWNICKGTGTVAIPKVNPVDVAVAITASVMLLGSPADVDVHHTVVQWGLV